MIKIEIGIEFADKGGSHIEIRDVEDDEKPAGAEEKAIAKALVEGINWLMTFAIRLGNPAYKEVKNDDI